MNDKTYIVFCGSIVAICILVILGWLLFAEPAYGAVYFIA